MDKNDISMKYAKKCKAIFEQDQLGMRERAWLVQDIELEEDKLHPMLQKVSSLIWYMDESYSSDEEKQANWKMTVDTIDAYLNLEWEPTYWMAMIMYGIREHGKLVHSFTVVVRRRNGTCTFESGSEVLRLMVEEVCEQIAPHQTDEWFLNNMTFKLPTIFQDFHQESISINEQLRDPWVYLRG